MSDGQAVAVETAVEHAPATEPVNYSTTSDEGILGMPEGSEGMPVGDNGAFVTQRPEPAEPEQASETKPEAQAERAKPTEEAKTEEPEPEKIERDEKLMPREVTAALKAMPDKRTAEALRAAYFSNLEFRKNFPTVAAARQAAETLSMFSGPEEARGMAEQALRMANVDTVLAEGDETQRQGLFASVISDVGPERAANIAVDYLLAWKAADERGFDQIMRSIAELRGYGGEATAAEPSPYDEYNEPPEERQPDERDRELAALRQQLEQRNEQEARAARETEAAWMKNVNAKMAGGLMDMAAKAAPNAAQDGQEWIAGMALRQIVAALDQNPVYQAGIQQARAQGLEAAERYFLGRVARDARPAIQKFARVWTDQVLRHNGATVARKQEIAARGKDPGSGGAPGGERVSPQRAKTDYAKFDDRALLDM